VARETEARAWRSETGRLYVGFQNATAVELRASVYNRFARESGVGVQVFIEDTPGGLRPKSASPLATTGSGRTDRRSSTIVSRLSG